MKRTLLSLLSVLMAACDQETDNECEYACPSLEDFLEEAKAEQANDVTIKIDNTAYGPFVIQDPALSAAECEPVVDADPFVFACTFECGRTMKMEVPWPDGAGSYTITMRNPCGARAEVVAGVFNYYDTQANVGIAQPWI